MSEASKIDPLLEGCRNSIFRLTELSRGHHSPWMELDLSMRQTKAVFALARLAPASITGLGRTLGISEPTASLLVEELVSKHLAIRANDPSDRRRTLVELTDEGKALVDKFQAARDRQMMNWLELLDERELQAVLTGLDMMVQAAERCNATPKKTEDEE